MHSKVMLLSCAELLVIYMLALVKLCLPNSNVCRLLLFDVKGNLNVKVLCFNQSQIKSSHSIKHCLIGVSGLKWHALRRRVDSFRRDVHTNALVCSDVYVVPPLLTHNTSLTSLFKIST